MKHIRKKLIYLRSFVWFLMAGFFVVGFGGASILGPSMMEDMTRLRVDHAATQTLGELHDLGLLRAPSQSVLEELLTYQRKKNKSLAQVLRDPTWTQKLGLSSFEFKATWYAANPYVLLPSDLQQAIRETKKPFQTRREVERWCRVRKAPKAWVNALKVALVETTPVNLWRASQGKRPIAQNGHYLEPIVIERGEGDYEVRDGHIATDPRVIPTNTTLFIVVNVHGKDRLIKVKAADIGEAIKGKHVDLPIQFRPKSGAALPYIRFPSKYIGNATIRILMPAKKEKSSPNQKA